MRELGRVIYLVAGLWGLILTIPVLFEQIGFLGGLLVLVLCPVTLVAVPLYEGFVNSNWFPLVVIYGGGIAGVILSSIGSSESKRLPERSQFESPRFETLRNRLNRRFCAPGSGGVRSCRR